MSKRPVNCGICRTKRTTSLACSVCLKDVCAECINSYVPGSLNTELYQFLTGPEIRKLNAHFTCHECEPSSNLPQSFYRSVKPDSRDAEKRKDELVRVFKLCNIANSVLDWKKKIDILPSAEGKASDIISSVQVEESQGEVFHDPRPEPPTPNPASAQTGRGFFPATREEEKEKGTAESETAVKTAAFDITSVSTDRNDKDKGGTDPPINPIPPATPVPTSQEAKQTEGTGPENTGAPINGGLEREPPIPPPTDAATAALRKQAAPTAQVLHPQVTRTGLGRASPVESFFASGRSDGGRGKPPPLLDSWEAERRGMDTWDLPFDRRLEIPRGPSPTPAAHPGQGQDALQMLLTLQREQEKARREIEREREVREARLEQSRRESEERTAKMMMEMVAKITESKSSPSPNSSISPRDFLSSTGGHFKRKVEFNPEVPIFSGAKVDFPRWWSLYKALVHDQEHVSETIKFYLLDKALRKSSIYHLMTGYDEIEGGDYAGAIDRILLFFGKSNQSNESAWSLLIEAPLIKADFSNFMEINSKIHGAVHILEKKGIPMEAINPHAGIWLAKQPRQLIDNCNLQRVSRNSAKGIGSEGISKPWEMKELLDILDTLAILYTPPEKKGNKPTETSKSSKDDKKGKGKNREEKNKKKVKSEKTDDNFSLALSQASDSPKQEKGDGSKQKFRRKGRGDDKDEEKSAYFKEGYCHLCKEKSHYTRACRKYKTLAERKKRVADEGLCSNCLKSTHKSDECRSPYRCGVCDGKHHTCLHEESSSAKKKTQSVQQTLADSDSDSGADEFPQILQSDQPKEEGVVLRPKMIIFPAHLIGEESDEKIDNCGVFVDGGGAESYIREACAEKLNLPILKKKMKRIARFGDDPSQELKVPSKLVSFILEGRNGHRIRMKAWTIPQPCQDVLDHPVCLTDGEKKKVQAMKILNPPPRESKRKKIHLLVGKDFEAEIIYASKNPIVQINKSLVVHVTPFGNVLAGSTRSSEGGNKVTPIQSLQCNNSSLDDLERVFRCEGIENEEVKKLQKAKDQLLIEKFAAQLDFREGKYESGLMWKNPEPKLGTNLLGAKSRLGPVVSRLHKHNALLEYDGILMDLVNRRIAEILEDVDVEAELAKEREHLKSEEHTGNDCQVCLNSGIYYLSHFDVRKEDAVTSKRRVVMDGSAAVQPSNQSLNDLQEKGPNSIQSLTGVVNRSRVADGFLVADTEKMYLSMLVKEEERDRIRFLWIKDPTNPKLKNNMIVLRYRTPVFGMICSSFILQQTFRIHISRLGGDLAEKLQDSTFVDNFVIAVNNGDKHDYQSVYRRTKEIFQQGGFNVRQWASSDQKFNEAMAGSVDAHPDLGKEKFGVLGLVYRPGSDTYSYKEQKISMDVAMGTKREILRLLARFGFDPIGGALPLLMAGRLLIQQLWINKSGWDEPVGQEIIEAMRKILQSLLRLSELRIPRQIRRNTSDPVTVIVFSDASERALAACVYFWQEGGGGLYSHLAKAQGKVASLKPQRTIVQKELNALLMGIRLAKESIEECKVKVDSLHAFSDSQIILYQCITEKSLPKYNQTRVDEIMAAAPVLHHVVGELNVADGPSRGLLYDEVDWKSWLHGPEFVREGRPEDWVVFQYVPPANPEDEEEAQLIQGAEAEEDESEVLKVVEDETIARFSTLNQLIAARAWARRWVEKTRRRMGGRKDVVQVQGNQSFNPAANVPSPVFPSFITAKERKYELKMLVRMEQGRRFPKEKEALDNGEKTSLGKQLDLFMDDEGIIRVGGRACRAPLSMDQIHPMLVSHQSRLTHLIIDHAHRIVGHQRLKATKAEVKTKFWVTGGESAFNRVIKGCADCLKVKGGRLQPPPFSSLPAARLGADRAFQYTGLDHTGEIKIRDGKEEKSIHILLFTCLTTRAVSLQWTDSTSAKDTILALRRFISTRGRPDIIYSDQASGYLSAKEYLGKEQNQIGQFLASSHIEWKLQKPRSPWSSGVWERLIGSTKKILRHCLWRRKVSLVELETFLAEAEGILNTRPIAELSEDDLSGAVLTPAHFIAPSSQLGLPYSMEATDDDPDFPTKSSGENLQKAFQVNEKMMRMAWQSFNRDYFLILRDSSRLLHKESKGELAWSPIVNRVYLIREEGKNRQAWKHGKVIKLLPSGDGLIRFVRIRLPSGHVTERGVRDLYPLEAQLGEEKKVITHRCPEKKEETKEKKEVEEKTVPSKEDGNGPTHRYNLRRRKEEEKREAKAQLSSFPSLFKSIPTLMLILTLWLPVSEAGNMKESSTHQICVTGPGGRVVEVPEKLLECESNFEKRNSIDLLAKVYVPRSEYPIIPAIMCYLESIEVCTSWAFLGGSGLVQPPVTTRKAVPRFICSAANSTGTFNGSTLVKLQFAPGHRSTNLSLEVEYKWPSAKHCSSITNFVIESGSLTSLDGTDVVSSLDHTGDCHFGAGHCETPESTIIWESKNLPEATCPFESLGTLPATLRGNLLTVASLQAAFHLNNSLTQPDCIPESKESLNGTRQGVFVQLSRKKLRHRRSSRSAQNDPVNAKLNFYGEKLTEIIEDAFLANHQMLCEVSRRELQFKLLLARIDATVGVRALLERNDVVGEWKGSKLVMHQCQPINASFVYSNYSFKDICYKLRPVQIEGSSKVWFEAPSGRDLVPFSPTISCHLIQNTEPEGKVSVEESLQAKVAWKVPRNLEPMDAPPLFKGSAHYPASVIGMLAAEAGPLHTKLHGALVYSSKLADDSTSFLQIMEGAAKFIGELREEEFKVIGGIVETGTEAAGKLAGALAHPITRILYALAACLAIILIIVLVGYYLYRRFLRNSTTFKNRRSETIRKLRRRGIKEGKREVERNDDVPLEEIRH